MVNMITQHHKISYHIITIIWMYYIFIYIYIYIHWVLMISKAWLRCTLIGQSKLHHLSQSRSSQANFAGFYSSHRSSPHFKTFQIRSLCNHNEKALILVGLKVHSGNILTDVTHRDSTWQSGKSFRFVTKLKRLHHAWHFLNRLRSTSRNASACTARLFMVTYGYRALKICQ